MLILQKGVDTTVEVYVSCILDRMKKIRKEKGLTQSDMGKKLGISTMGYSHLESGDRSLTLYRLCEISSALKTNLINLLGIGDLATPVIQDLLAQKDHTIADLHAQLKQQKIINDALASKINGYESGKNTNS